MAEEVRTPFRGILVGTAASKMGSSTAQIALPLVVLDLTDSAFMMSSVFALEMLVCVAGGFFTGAIVDRTVRKNAMILADLTRGMSVGLLVVSYVFVPSAVLLLVAAVIMVMCISDMFFEPASFSLLPTVVPPNRLDSANALISSTSTSASIVGVLVGSVGFAFFGPIVSLSASLLAFVVSATTIAVLVNITERDRPRTYGTEPTGGLTKDIIQSFAFIQKNKFLVTLISIGIAMNFFSCTISIFLPLFSRSSFELLGVSYGILSVAMEIGAIAGGIILAVRSMNRVLMLSAGIAGEGAGMLLLGLAGPIIFAAEEVVGLCIAGGFCFVIGFSMILLNVPITSWMQLTVPDNLRGKVRMVQSSLVTIPMPVSFIVFGYLAETVNVYLLLGINGSITIVTGVAAFLVMTPLVGKSK